MNKTIVIFLTAAAAIAIILQSSHSHAASTNQVDVLKAQFLPPEYRNTNFTVDDLKKVFREKCKKITGSENVTLYQGIETGIAKLVACLSTIANLTAIQQEIEQARPIGELDTVFHKYCSKAPEAEKCFRTFNEKIQPCLSPEEKNQNAIMMRVGSGLLNFMCDRGGNQIALFVAEEGPECLEANKEAIGHCLNTSFSEYLPKDGSMPDLYNIPELVLAPEHCIDLQRFEACTLHHLEQCQEITPVNVAESVFKYIKNETKCQTFIDLKANERPVLRDARDAASLPHCTLVLVGLGTLLLLLLDRFFMNGL